MFGNLPTVLFLGVVLSAASVRATCSGAEVKGKVQSVADSTVSQHTTVVADLELTCKGGVPSSFPLYAEYNGKLYAAARNEENPKKYIYQISISDETKNFASSGIAIKVYDEDGYQLVRKGNTGAKALATLDHSIRYPYSGPSINSELFVVLTGAAAVYIAHGTLSKM
ncbi:uncharacterized protein LOC129586394 [Paramacrobiotus metropolitanus]|uniref:uncharacterized protein LOC129586394 n=1 Tax=Paramacrobiotus metropolitanus TaxID=2943436 RepID=UPI002445ECF8|nr:uncharacterized protein LOC129586394 [Paramacrobiotus metropolitanus]XP_055335594.1 uncharacterized protein LOC129586394 [Paramacrobiotus metropolitanus]